MIVIALRRMDGTYYRCNLDKRFPGNRGLALGDRNLGLVLLDYWLTMSLRGLSSSIFKKIIQASSGLVGTISWVVWPKNVYTNVKLHMLSIAGI